MQVQALSSSDLETKILLTLRYSHLFHFALTAPEIWQRLPSSKALRQFFRQSDSIALLKEDVQTADLTSKKCVHFFTKTLLKLEKQGQIIHQAPYYCLQKRDITQRLSRKKIVREKQRAIQEAVHFLKKIPMIHAIVVTGSVAVENAQANDDLDFLIVCRAQSLWITRLLVLGLSMFYGKRPHLDKAGKTQPQDKNAWCFNLWLEENSLTMPPTKRGLYEAYEILQMQWVYDPYSLQPKLLRDNGWLAEQLPFFAQAALDYSTKKNLPPATSTRQNLDTANKHHIFLGFKYLWSRLNDFCFLLQICFRRWFHPQDKFLLSKNQAFFSGEDYPGFLYQQLQ